MSDLKFRWLEVLGESELPDKAVRVGVAVWTYTDKDGRNAYPGYERLAKRANVSVATVKRMLKLLRDAGMIQKIPKVKRAYNDTYYLRLPSIEGQSCDPQSQPNEGHPGPIEGQIGATEGQSSDPTKQVVITSSENKTPAAPPELQNDAFYELQRAYPRAVSTDEYKARKMLDRLTAEGVTPEVLVGCARRYAAECIQKNLEVRYIKYLSSWLASSWTEYELVEYHGGPSPRMITKAQMKVYAAEAEARARRWS